MDSVSLSDPQKPPSQYLQIQLAVFPSGGDSFNWTGVSRIGFALSNQTYKPPAEFGPFYFIADPYLHFSGNTTSVELKPVLSSIVYSSIDVTLFLDICKEIELENQESR